MLNNMQNYANLCVYIQNRQKETNKKDHLKQEWSVIFNNVKN